MSYFFRFFYKAFFPFKNFPLPLFKTSSPFGNPLHFFDVELSNMCKYIGNVGACRSATILDITFHEFVLMISAEIMLKVETNGQ